jgi:Ca2+-binding RTX toxin-like protein
LLFGGNGADYLDGEENDDTLDRGAGADTLLGRTGNDFLQGGADYDVYYYCRGQGKDTIVDGGGNGPVIYWGETATNVSPSDITFQHLSGVDWRIKFDNQNYVDFKSSEITDINLYNTYVTESEWNGSSYAVA